MARAICYRRGYQPILVSAPSEAIFN